jgi:hypothetical protein
MLDASARHPYFRAVLTTSSATCLVSRESLFALKRLTCKSPKIKECVFGPRPEGLIAAQETPGAALERRHLQLLVLRLTGPERSMPIARKCFHPIARQNRMHIPTLPIPAHVRAATLISSTDLNRRSRPPPCPSAVPQKTPSLVSSEPTAGQMPHLSHRQQVETSIDRFQRKGAIGKNRRKSADGSSYASPAQSLDYLRTHKPVA